MDGNEEVAMRNLEILQSKTDLKVFPISAKQEQNIVAVTSYLRFLTEKRSPEEGGGGRAEESLVQKRKRKQHK